MLKYKIKLKNIRSPWKKFQKTNKHWAFNKTVRTGKKQTKLIKVGPIFIPDYRSKRPS